MTTTTEAQREKARLKMARWRAKNADKHREKSREYLRKYRQRMKDAGEVRPVERSRLDAKERRLAMPAKVKPVKPAPVAVAIPVSKTRIEILRERFAAYRKRKAA